MARHRPLPRRANTDAPVKAARQFIIEYRTGPMSVAVFTEFAEGGDVSAEDARPQYFSVVEAIKAKEATPERRLLAEASLRDLATPEWSKARVQSRSKIEVMHEPFGRMRRAPIAAAQARQAVRAATAAEYRRRKWGTPPVPTNAILAPEPPT